MKVVLDTSAVVALVAAGDPNHDAARRIWRSIGTEGSDLVVPNYVIAETLSLTSRRFGMAGARAAHTLMSLASPIFVDPVEHAAATRRFLASGRSLSFVDCSTFAVMTVRSLETAFAFDDDFTHAGFTLLTA
ncbi:MAG: PIN domain-containing protein [Thermoleophilia bacterium]|nr:PIN domain-containing protein [Thermoleophilia bacterium]